MKWLDAVLNKVSMYRLVVYGLGLMVLAAVFLALVGRLALSPVSLVVSLGLLVGACFGTEVVLARVWRMPYNAESWLITALIMFFIVRPPQTVVAAVVVVTAGMVAIASKYLLAWRGKHIFNPAAFGAAFVSLTALQTVSWWVGNAMLWPLALLVGVAVVRKVRQFELVLTFVAVSMGLQLVLIVQSGQPVASNLQQALIASPLIFLATIMLTEPATMPPQKKPRLTFAALVAVLYVTAWKLGPLYIYPEVALLLGNVYAFWVAPRFKIRLRLTDIQQISDHVYNFVFQPDQKFAFQPGQYMEWTLPGVPFDSRGNRRTFTIASSPTEDNVQVGVKFYNPSSAYKCVMSRMQPGDTIYASQLSGSFTLPRTPQKLAFIAGGIGITPFRSMVKYLTDQNISCDIIIIYVLGKPEELAYKDEFLAAQSLGIKLIPVLSRKHPHAHGMMTARLDQTLIEKTIPDYQSRLFYISGPDAMVTSTTHLLRALGVHQSAIKTDHFSGY